MGFFKDLLVNVADKCEEAQGLKGEYAHLSNKELMTEFKKGSGGVSKNLAITSLLKDRGYELRNGQWYR